MELDYKVLDELLLGESETDDITLTCKEEIQKFVVAHDFDVFSEASLEELAGVWDLSMAPTYEHLTHDKIPNVFYNIKIKDQEEDGNQVE